MNGKAIARAGIAAATILATAPVVHAETLLTVNGARPLPDPLNSILGGLTTTEYGQLSLDIGANWLPGSSPTVVDYPASVGLLWGLGALTGDQSIATGQTNLHAAIVAAAAGGEPVIVAGLSMGTLVIDAELAFLATDPNAPPADKLSFVLFASPGRGLASLFPAGLQLPIFGFTTRLIPETQYDTSVVFTQYDVWADIPDRPWNLIALANAAMSFVTRPELHTPTAIADQSEAVIVSTTINTKGATITLYMIPTHDLPLTDPLRLIGVPTWVTDAIDTVLRPMVDAGYSRNDTGPIRAPYISQGHLVVPGLTLGAALPPAAASDDTARTRARDRSHSRPGARGSADENESSPVDTPGGVERDPPQPRTPVAVRHPGHNRLSPTAVARTAPHLRDRTESVPRRRGGPDQAEAAVHRQPPVPPRVIGDSQDTVGDLQSRRSVPQWVNSRPPLEGSVS